MAWWNDVEDFFSDMWKKITGSSSKPKTCDTTACLESAEYLKASMNFSINPCDDFYHYACGNYNQNHLKEKGVQSTLRDAFLRNAKANRKYMMQRNKECEPKILYFVRHIFITCLMTGASIDPNGIKPLKNALKSVNLTTYPPEVLSTPEFDLIRTTCEMRKSLGVEMFFSITLDEWKPENVSKRSISILRPSMVASPLPAMQTPPMLGDVYPKMKRDYILTAFSLLCENSTKGLCKENNLRLIAEILETYLNDLFFVRYPRSNRTNTSPLFFCTLPELQNITNMLAHDANVTTFDWYKVLTLMFPNESIQRLEEMQLVLESPYVENALNFIFKYAYGHELGVWWTVVEALSEYTATPLRDAKRAILDEFVTKEDRETWCEELVFRLYGPVVSYRYNVDPTYVKAKSEVKKMTENIREAFLTSLSASSWLDATSKSRAVSKIKSMDAFIGFPDNEIIPTIPEYTYGMELDENYLHLRYVEEQYNFLETVLIKIKDDSKYAYEYRNYREINREIKKRFFYIYPATTTNAIYFLPQNSIFIPAGIFGPPLYNQGSLAALNYGSTGTGIGHEFAHALETSAQYNNSFGLMENLWNNKTLEKFFLEEDCFEDTYNKLRVNGLATMKENIADNVGFQQALRAYRSYVKQNGAEPRLPHFEDLTHEQLFTLAFANAWCGPEIPPEYRTVSVHSPAQARLLGVLSNSEEFSRIWNCPAGTGMNRIQRKCTLW